MPTPSTDSSGQRSPRTPPRCAHAAPHRPGPRSRRWLLLGALLTAFGSGAALAQSTLGELLDAGGVKLSREQVVATVTGATLSGPNAGGGTSEIGYKADGSYSGSYQGRPGARGAAREGGVFGTWSVNEGGRLCMEGHGGAGKETARCLALYRVGDQLYEVFGAEANRAAVALKRTVKR